MEEKTTTPWLHARWVKRQWSAGGWWRNETKPPKKFFCSLETEKENKGGGGDFLTQCLLCFLSFWKLRDFSADRVGDSLHSLVFWRTCSPELYRPNKGLIREERVRERERERDPTSSPNRHMHTHGVVLSVCAPVDSYSGRSSVLEEEEEKRGEPVHIAVAPRQSEIPVRKWYYIKPLEHVDDTERHVIGKGFFINKKKKE